MAADPRRGADSRGRRPEPWPWALALLLLAMIGVSLSLYAIATTHPDPVVRHEASESAR